LELNLTGDRQEKRTDAPTSPAGSEIVKKKKKKSKDKERGPMALASLERGDASPRGPNIKRSLNGRNNGQERLTRECCSNTSFP